MSRPPLRDLPLLQQEGSLRDNPLLPLLFAGNGSPPALDLHLENNPLPRPLPPPSRRGAWGNARSRTHSENSRRTS